MLSSSIPIITALMGRFLSLGEWEYRQAMLTRQPGEFACRS